MQDPNEDTEWNDILRKKGIIPEKEKEITEDDIINMVESTIDEKTRGTELKDKNLDELDELEDEEDEQILLEYRKKRIAELKMLAEKSKFGHVIEISGKDYIEQVNNAGSDVYVILHLYKTGIPLCALINRHMNELSQKFPTVKFIKSIASTCIPNYPEQNLPTIFVYFEGNMTHKFIGPNELQESITVEELEYMLGQANAIKTDIDANPRRKIKDAMFSQLDNCNNDW